jgi:hypothetical protein
MKYSKHYPIQITAAIILILFFIPQISLDLPDNDSSKYADNSATDKPAVNWINNTNYDFNSMILDNDDLTFNTQENHWDIDSTSNRTGNTGFLLQVWGSQIGVDHQVHLQLWGEHVDSSGERELLKHGFEKYAGSISSTTNLITGEIFMFGNGANGTIGAPRIDGCYWVQTKITIPGNSYEQYLVIESKKINFSSEANYCANSQDPPSTSDSDNDGVIDSLDLCPSTPADSYVDSSGCPVTDSDNDGVIDSLDLCPSTPADSYVDSSGCPVTDSDNDGIIDDLDICPSTPTDSYVDSSGCPVTDLDDDGVIDSLDRCSSTSPGSYIDSSGCPAIDSDNDGIVDSLDLCTSTPVGSFVNIEGCRNQNLNIFNEETVIEDECKLTKSPASNCDSELILIGGGIVGGIATTSIVNRIRKPKREHHDKPMTQEKSPDGEPHESEKLDSDTKNPKESKKIEKNKSEYQQPISIPIFIIEDANLGVHYSNNLTHLVDGSSPGDNYISKYINKNNWASVSVDGIVSGVPGDDDVGLTMIQVRVKNSQGMYADVEIRINVSDEIESKENNPPSWKKP